MGWQPIMLVLRESMMSTHDSQEGLDWLEVVRALRRRVGVIVA